VHFHEILSENLKIGYTKMRKILINAGYQSPKSRKKHKKIHKTQEKQQEFKGLSQTGTTLFLVHLEN
jgi:hypothetical protein